MFDQAPLQAYQGRLPKRASDAESIDDDIYASDADPMTEEDPQGLMDRLYREQLSGQPMRGVGGPSAVPSTKRTYMRL